jgi:hypothetical protein
MTTSSRVIRTSVKGEALGGAGFERAMSVGDAHLLIMNECVTRFVIPNTWREEDSLLLPLIRLANHEAR